MCIDIAGQAIKESIFLIKILSKYFFSLKKI